MLRRLGYILLLFVLCSLFAGCGSNPKNTTPKHTVSDQTATWNLRFSSRLHAPTTASVTDAEAQPHWGQYGANFVVEARVLEVLPDLYAAPEKTLCRKIYTVLRLEVLDTVLGNGVPKEIYYLLDAYRDPNLNEYDSLIISMRQLSIGSYLLLNTTTQGYERFEPMFASGTWTSSQKERRVYPDPTELTLYSFMTVLPFTDGVLDSSIYEKWGWKNEYADYVECLAGDYLIQRRFTLQQAKDAIRKYRQDYLLSCPPDRAKDIETLTSTVRYPDIYPDKEKFLELSSFESGIFTQYLYSRGKTVFCRMVNGFYTNEYYIFTPGEEMVASTYRFTPEELENLPDLLPMIGLATQKLYPDHAPYEQLFDGYYYKTERGIYGVVQLYFGQSIGPSPSYINYIRLPDGQTKLVTTEALEAYLNDDWVLAEKLNAWMFLEERAYRGDIVYESRADEYVYPFFKKIYLTPDGNGIYYGYQGAGILRATLVDPKAIGLDAILESDRTCWKEYGLGYQELTNTVLFAWQLQENTDPRPLRYLLKLDDGSLLLATGYDYTGVYEDGGGAKTIQYIFRLTVDGGKYAFFDEWESSVKRIKDKRPELYELWKQLKNTYL